MTIPGIPINPLRQSDLDEALDAWIVTWDSIEAGSLPISRLPSVVARRDEANTFAANVANSAEVMVWGNPNITPQGSAWLSTTGNPHFSIGGRSGVRACLHGNSSWPALAVVDTQVVVGANAHSATPASGAALTVTGNLTASGGTVTADSPVLSMSQTWNNAAVAFTALRTNITATASAMLSKHFDFQVNGSSQIWSNVRYDNVVQAPSLHAGTAFMGQAAGGHAAFGMSNSGGSCFAWVSGGGIGIPSDRYLGFGSTNDAMRSVNSSWVDSRISKASSGVLQIGTTSNNALGSLNLANLTASGGIVVNNSSGSNVGIDVRPWVYVRGNTGLLSGWLGNGASSFSSGASAETDLGLRAIGAIGFSTNNSATPSLVIGTNGNITASGTVTVGSPASGSAPVISQSSNSLRVVFDTTQTTQGVQVRGTDNVTYWTVGSMLQSGNQYVQLDGTSAGSGQGRLNLGGGFLHVEGGPSSTAVRSFGTLNLSPAALGGSGVVQVNGNLTASGTVTGATGSRLANLIFDSADNNRIRSSVDNVPIRIVSNTLYGLGITVGSYSLAPNDNNYALGSGNNNFLALYMGPTANGARVYSGAKHLRLEGYESSLSAWQESVRVEASPSGALFSVLGATPIGRQTLPAAATDLATTQALCNAIRSALISFGFCN